MSKESAYFIAKSVSAKQSTAKIKQRLGGLYGVSAVSVNDDNNLVAVDYDSAGLSYDKIENYLNQMGFEIAADASNILTR